MVSSLWRKIRNKFAQPVTRTLILYRTLINLMSWPNFVLVKWSLILWSQVLSPMYESEHINLDIPSLILLHPSAQDRWPNTNLHLPSVLYGDYTKVAYLNLRIILQPEWTQNSTFSWLLLQMLLHYIIVINYIHTWYLWLSVGCWVSNFNSTRLSHINLVLEAITAKYYAVMYCYIA